MTRQNLQDSLELHLGRLNVARGWLATWRERESRFYWNWQAYKRSEPHSSMSPKQREMQREARKMTEPQRTERRQFWYREYLDARHNVNDREREVSEEERVIARRRGQLAAAKPLRVRALEVARTQVGVVESGGNNQGVPFERYQRANNAPGPEAWCGDFVKWCYVQAGSKLTNRMWASTIWLLAQLTPVKDPQPGHVVVYDFNPGTGADHTGLFDEWIDKGAGEFWAIEGNTGPVNASDGGGGEGVHRKRRNLNIVAGFRRISG